MGLVERFHSTLLEIYRLAKYERKFTDALSVMTYAIMSYNHTIHPTTGLTPFEVVSGHTGLTSTFDVEFNKNYTQHLLQDHKKRNKYLYEYLTDKMIGKKENIKEKRGGEKEFNIKEGDAVFMKGRNVRRSKDKARYLKTKVTGDVVRNVLPVTLRSRDTKAPIEDIKRPSQVHLVPDAASQKPDLSTSAG